MKVLIACEMSGRTRESFRKLGHTAYSCDLVDSLDNSPFHIKGDVLSYLNEGWDLMIAHPPCQYLTFAAVKYWNDPGRAELREKAMEFFMKFINAPIERIAVENPVGYPNQVYRKPDQIIHPYYFGEPQMKRTCLWLKNLPLLEYDKELAKTKPQPIYTDEKAALFYFGEYKGSVNDKVITTEE